MKKLFVLILTSMVITASLYCAAPKFEETCTSNLYCEVSEDYLYELI